MVNLKAVAATAGVSLATASRALGPRADSVTPELRDRVQAAARALDYVPNAQARSLHRATSGVIGVVIGDLADPYFSTMAAGIQEQAATLGYPVTFCSTQRDIRTELDYLFLLQAQRARLVIIAGSGIMDEAYRTGLASRIASLRSTGARVVTMGRHEVEGADNVSADNVQAGELVGAHLVALGHRQVAVLAGSMSVTSTIDRIRGLRQVIEGAGGTVQVVPVAAATRDGGLAASRDLLLGPSSATAFVGTADQMAIGAMVGLREAGVRIPQQASVVGCNDIELARDVSPALTTVSVPLRQMGQQAVTLGLQDPGAGPAQVLLPVELVVRHSSGPPPHPPAPGS